jgi:hypothetical protein
LRHLTSRTCRVLRKGNGMFLYLTFGQPHFRRRYLTRTGTTLEIQQIGDAFHYYLYILRNRAEPPVDSVMHAKSV